MENRTDPFLKQIAIAYDNENPDGLERHIFVFPNRRSSLFFQKYLREAKGTRLRDFNVPFLSPETVTFDDLVERWCDSVTGERSELLIALYASYLSVASDVGVPDEAVMDLSAFMFWGDVILNDFNEIDLEMADASDVLRNLRDLKSIETNPLDSEKWELVKQFWDTTGFEHLIPDETDDSRLWIDYELLESDDGRKHTASRSFFKIWQILGSLYKDFRKRLSEMGLHYRGMALRNVAEKLVAEKDQEILFTGPDIKYVFAGFNTLSKAELTVMDVLYRRGVADFFWDTGISYFGLKENGAAKEVESLSEKYPSPFDLDVPEHTPRISIIGVPSEIGQVKEASSVLASLDIKPHEASSTAVVLADEALCVPLLHSLNLRDGVDVNITMGYPLRLSPVASVVETLSLMHAKARYIKEEDTTTFFRDDVNKLLSHPLFLRLAPEECRELAKHIERLRLFNIPAVGLQQAGGRLAPLFIGLKGIESGEAAFQCIREAVNCILDLFPEPVCTTSELPEGEESDEVALDLWLLDRSFLRGYLDELDILQQNILHVLGHNVNYGGTSAMRAIARIMSGRKVSFNGAPLRGIQVLGIDETRTLDFERIVAVSMNERVFPKRSQSPTFIPHTLRRAYGLPTAERKEAEISYSFYRMIARAEEVWLVYNANTEGMTSGEMSRYLYQLVYAYHPEGLTSVVKNYHVDVFPHNEIRIEKSDIAMTRLADFLPDASVDSRRYFSASAIRQLLDCELKFYLEYVAGFQMPDEVKSYIDDSIYGKIVHETFECLYNHQARKQNRADGGALLTSQLLSSLMRDPLVDRYIIRSINHIYHSRKGAEIASVSDELDTPLDGESTMFAALIKKSVIRVLEAEAEWLKDKYEVIYMHGESDDRLSLSLTSDLRINFRHIIDRIDLVRDTQQSEPYLRLVDYKTGREELRASTVGHLVDYGLSGDNVPPHGITQLMLYCNSYSELTGNIGRIQPFIYNLRDIVNSGSIEEIKVGPACIDPATGKMSRSLPILADYRDINDEFMTLMSEKISRLFDNTVPFEQPESDRNCRYCNFREICNRG
jgi:Inactivated superfamily I helicase